MAVKLSARLKEIASNIDPGESVCDVGTDHGYLPIYLALQGGHDPLIMSDVSKGSLAKAVADAKEELPEGELPEARLGDGLDVLKPGEVDTIVIAGMGGLQILDILNWDLCKSLTYRKYIFQPRRDAALLRKWLEVNHFRLVRQSVVPENGRFSEVIAVSTDGARKCDAVICERMTVPEVFGGDFDELARYEYPDDLVDPSGKDVILRFYESEIAREEMIAHNIENNSGASGSAADMHRARIRRLEKLCGRKS